MPTTPVQLILSSDRHEHRSSGRLRNLSSVNQEVHMGAAIHTTASLMLRLGGFLVSQAFFCDILAKAGCAQHTLSGLATGEVLIPRLGLPGAF